MVLDITPIKNPVAIFTLIISIILFVPYLSRKINIPSIFGLILAGVIIGPNGSGFLDNNQGVSIFGTVGLLYIMFLAGLEINMSSFVRNRNKSLFFGAATFFIPLITGFFILKYLLNFAFLPALLVSSMFSTHTLLSYPIVSRLNITRRESVVVTIGGTIITDTAVLLLLTVITTAYEGKLNGMFWLQLIVLLAVFVFVVLWGLPKIARWYFDNFQSDGTQQYVFVLVAMFLSAMLGKWAGIEPIVGAFLSGLALNRVIPSHSPLMNRTVFIGNSLFIPFFLISVGMLVNLKVLFSGPDTLIIAFVLISVAIAGKFLAASLTQWMYKYSRTDRNLIFGLSSSHAAATIAVIMVGYQIGLLDDKVLNGTILLILATCLVSSFMTEYAGRTIALYEADPVHDLTSGSERILVPVAKPESFKKLVDLALFTRLPKSDSVIYSLSIINDDNEASQTARDNRNTMEKLSAHAAAADVVVTPLTRVDINIPSGISRAAKELLATRIVIGWSGRSSTVNYFFGNIIDNLLESTRLMIMVVKINEPIVRLKHIYVMVPVNACKEVGFYGWVNALMSLSKNSGGIIKFLAPNIIMDELKTRMQAYKSFNDNNYIPYGFYPNISLLPIEIEAEDLLVAISARPSMFSFSRRQIVLPRLMTQLGTKRFMIIYPEQVDLPEITD
ncbi:MAG: cation:proton antiporter [Bacteroidota bacterium]|nr:cation:proton antiporter [Bacteroidota bacterium]